MSKWYEEIKAECECKADVTGKVRDVCETHTEMIYRVMNKLAAEIDECYTIEGARLVLREWDLEVPSDEKD